MRANAIPKILSAILFLLAFGIPAAQAAVDSKGTDFFVAFAPNFLGGGNNSLFVTSDQNTQGVVQIPGLNFQESFTVEANRITVVSLPQAAQRLLSNRVNNLGVHITAQNEVTVYGLNQSPATTDAFLALPVDALGLEYLVMSYRGPVQRGNFPSQVVVVGVFDNTQVTIVPSDSASGRTRGVPFTITLNSNDVFYLRGRFQGNELTGTSVKATAPVAVFGASACAHVPPRARNCDHMVEMMPPVVTWGESFLTVPLATRLRGDRFRILASQNNTEVRINGALVATLNAGRFLERVLTTASQIETSAPALVAQFSQGSSVDGVRSDPFMMLISPAEQFLSNYTVSTPQLGFDNHFVNVVIPTAEVGSLVLDGNSVDETLFSPIGASGFSGAQVPITQGSHTLSAAVPFGAYVYGFGFFDSYGYPGGTAFEFINPTGDSFSPNVRLTPLDDTIFGTATDSEDLNANGVLDPGEDLNGNGMIGRRSEDLNGNGILDAGEDTNNNGVLDRDTGIFRVELDPGSSNLLLNVNPFVPSALRVDFTITVIDRNQPGTGVLRIVDGAGNTTETPITLSLVPTLGNVRVIDTLSTDDIELDTNSFSVPPHSITTVDGQTVIEWRFDRISVDQIQDIDFDVILRNPIPGEQRLVSHKLELIYNDVNGNEVRTELGPQVVNVLTSIFQIGVDTDRASYTANEQVIITTNLTNRGAFAANATVRLSVKDAAGSLVAELGVQPDVPLSPGESKQLTGTDFFTGTTLEGQYEVHAELLDQSGQPFALAVAPFLVVTPSAEKVAAAVTTDKQVYAPLETVNVQNRVTNKTPNAILDGLTAVTTIFDPGNQVFFTQSTALPQLLPNALRDVNLEVPLGRALPGIYRIMLVVKDAQGIERALAETEITVQSTAETGSGLKGSLSVTPNPVLKTEFANLSAGVQNLGNSDMQNLPLTLSIIDPGTEQVIIQWSETVANLATDGQHFIDRQWQALNPIGSTFVAVLNADIGGESRLLAQQVFAIREKIESQFTLGPRGRLLVLLDEAKRDGDSDSCAAPASLGLTSLELTTAFAPPLAADATVVVEAFDAQGVLVDSETVNLADFASPVNLSPGSAGVDLAITDFDHDDLSITLAERLSATGKLDTEYSVVASVWNDGNFVRIESGVIDTSCSQPIVVGDVHGPFAIAGLTTVPAEGQPRVDGDPHGPRDAPSLTEQRRFLETLLQREGWSYTIVTDEDAFTNELRSSGYAVYALLAEDVKLDEQVQKELREAVFRGEGLLVAGDHDRRNRKLEQALGVKVTGKHAKAAGLELLVSDLHPGGSAGLALGDKPLRAIATGASVVGRFTGLRAGDRDDDDDRDEDDRNEHDDERKDADGDADGEDEPDRDEDGDDDDDVFSDIAVTVHTVGAGRSVFGGFDLLAEATLAGEDSLFAQLLVNALGHVHPDPLTIRAGGVAPLRLTLTNRGTATPGQAVITLPPGSRVVDAGDAIIDSPTTLVWPFALLTDETAELNIWLRLPDPPDAVSIAALIQVGAAPDFIDHNTVVLSITPEANPTIADVIAQIDAIANPDEELDDAKESLQEAEEELNEGDIEDALEELIEATDELIESSHPQAPDIRQQVDRVIWRVGQLL